MTNIKTSKLPIILIAVMFFSLIGFLDIYNTKVLISNGNGVNILDMFCILMICAALLRLNQLKSVNPGFIFLCLGFVIFNVVYGMVYMNTEIDNVVREVRPFFYYSLYIFIICFIEKDSIKKLVNIIEKVVLGGAILCIIQFLLGPNTIILGKPIGYLENVSGQGYTEFLRVSSYLTILIQFFFFKNVYSVFGEQKEKKSAIVNILILTGALLVAFTRNVLATTLLGTFILLMFSKDKAKYIYLSTVSGMLLVFAVSLFTQNDIISTVVERITSTFDKSVLKSSSIIWREFENKTALAVFKEKPILGIGIGNSYHNIPMFTYAQFYVHNLYVYVLLKMGAVGFMLFIAGILSVFRKIIISYKNAVDDFGRQLALCGILTITAILIGGVVSPVLFEEIKVLQVAFVVATAVKYNLEEVKAYDKIHFAKDILHKRHKNFDYRVRLGLE